MRLRIATVCAVIAAGVTVPLLHSGAAGAVGSPTRPNFNLSATTVDVGTTVTVTGAGCAPEAGDPAGYPQVFLWGGPVSNGGGDDTSAATMHPDGTWSARLFAGYTGRTQVSAFCSHYVSSFDYSPQYLIVRVPSFTLSASTITPSGAANVSGVCPNPAASVDGTPTNTQASVAIDLLDGTKSVYSATALSSSTGSWIAQINLAGSGIAPGSYPIVAICREYFGQTFQYAETSLAVKAPSTVSATLPSKITFGTAYSVPVSVHATGATPTGTVTLTSGGTTLGSATLSGGAASIAVSAANAKLLTPGSRALSVSYDGDGLVLPGASTPGMVPVLKAASRTTDRLSASRVKATSRASLVIVVRANGVTPSGNVVIYDGRKRIGVGTLKSGKATVKLPTLKAGRHNIVVVYGGSAGVAGSRARAVTLIVTA